MKVLFAGEAFEKMRSFLEGNLPGVEVITCPKGAILEHLDESVEVLVPPGQVVDARAMDRGRGLKLIQQWGVGVEGIDLEAARARGIMVSNVPSEGTGNADGVAEIAVLLALALARRFKEAQENLRRRVIWAPRGISLLNKTCCVVGLGGVGRALVRRLKGFGCRIIGVNRTEVDPASLGIDEFVPLSGVDEALSRSDFVFVCISMCPATEGFFDGRRIRAIKRGAFLVNVARGGVIDRGALVEALREGHLRGAGLDVFWEEPPDPEDEIFSLNVVATPHIGGLTDEAVSGIGRFVFENILRLKEGLRPHNVINGL